MLAHPCRTHQGDVRAKGLQQGHDELRILGVSSHKDGKCPILGTSVATCHGAVQGALALLDGGSVYLFCKGSIGGGHVDNNPSRAQSCQHSSLWMKDDFPHIHWVTDHHKDHVGVGSHLFWCRRRHRPPGHKLIGLASAAIEASQLIPCIHDVPRHGRPHDSGADPADAGHTRGCCLSAARPFLAHANGGAHAQGLTRRVPTGAPPPDCKDHAEDRQHGSPEAEPVRRGDSPKDGPG
mmetsp:Transcript_60906/g.108679  ORF Transcript_60906/g.108679 Transcript_60906/m.108679 type:complete len:237 (-) Transcript_60906:505-1215(-)